MKQTCKKSLRIGFLIAISLTLLVTVALAAGVPDAKGSGQTAEDPRIVYNFAQMKTALESEEFLYVQLGDGSAPINEIVPSGSDIYIKREKRLIIQNTYPEPQRFYSNSPTLNNLFVLADNATFVLTNEGSTQGIAFAPYYDGGSVILSTFGEAFNYGVNLTGMAPTAELGTGCAVNVMDYGWYTGEGGDLMGTSNCTEIPAVALHVTGTPSGDPSGAVIFRSSLSIKATNTADPESTAALLLDNGRVHFGHPMMDPDSEEIYFVQDYIIEPSDPLVDTVSYAVHHADGNSYLSNTTYRVDVTDGYAYTADTPPSNQIQAHYGEEVIIEPLDVDSFGEWIETEGYIQIDDITNAKNSFLMIPKDVYLWAEPASGEIITILKQPYLRSNPTVLTIDAKSTNEGYAPPLYQWFYSTTDTNLGGDPLGAQSRSAQEVTEHTLTHTLTDGSYYLFCMVTDPNTETYKLSGLIGITIDTGRVTEGFNKPGHAITIQKQPYLWGNPKTLSIEATTVNEGYAMPQYQWFYHDTNETVGGAPLGIQGYDQWEVSSHTLTHTLSDGSYYLYCVVTDLATGTTKTSDTIGITIDITGKVTEGFKKPVQFSDVKKSDWFYQPVYDAVRAKLMQGTSTTAFSPNDNASRSMVWTVLARLGLADVTGGNPWYAKAQKWAIAEGISDGTDPDSPITREQFVVMLYRYREASAVHGRLTFVDSKDVSSWAMDAMIWATKNGIITGDPTNCLNPQDNLTRAEMAAVLQRFLNPA